VLIVVKDRNVADFFEPALDLKAAGRADILQIDPAKRPGDQINRAYNLIHVLGTHADRKSVYIRKFLEKRAFAFHDRHTGLGPDIAKSKHGGTVGNDGNQIGTAGEFKRFAVILLNLQTGLGNAGRIRNRKIVPVVDLAPGNHLDLSLPVIVGL